MVENRKFTRPVIGVSGPEKGGTMAWLFSKMAVMMAGAKAIRITPSKPVSVHDIDGLIIGGGADVDPDLYGQKILDTKPDIETEGKTLKEILIQILSILFFPVILAGRWLFSVKSEIPIDKSRDELELKLIEQAFQTKKPILGICRGAQLINVFFKGSLYQNLKEFYIETPQVHSIFPKKNIQIEEGSKLASIFRTHSVKVNALHHQAIKEPGENISVVAREKSKVNQAIEHQTAEFILGVQWHPEYLPQIPRQRLLFKTLIKEAQNNKNTALLRK